jgi:hypothetical protein
MNARITILRVPKAPHEASDGSEAELNAETPQPIEGGQVIVDGRNHETFEKHPLLPDLALSFTACLRQTHILILKILQVFLRLKSSSSLNLNKIERFSKASSWRCKNELERLYDTFVKYDLTKESNTDGFVKAYMQGVQILRNEAYVEVRRNDER